MAVSCWWRVLASMPQDSEGKAALRQSLPSALHVALGSTPARSSHGVSSLASEPDCGGDADRPAPRPVVRSVIRNARRKGTGGSRSGETGPALVEKLVGCASVVLRLRRRPAKNRHLNHAGHRRTPSDCAISARLLPGSGWFSRQAARLSSSSKTSGLVSILVSAANSSHRSSTS